jgi:hypothetical protein
MGVGSDDRRPAHAGYENFASHLIFLTSYGASSGSANSRCCETRCPRRDSGSSLVQAVEELRALVPAGMTLTQMALRWILM